MTLTVRGQRAIRSSPGRSSQMPRNALGRGLGALIREPEPKSSSTHLPETPPGTASSGAAVALAREAAAAGPQEIDIDLIETSPYQTSKKVRWDALDELKHSLHASGRLHAIRV